VTGDDTAVPACMFFAGTGNCSIYHSHIVAWKGIKERGKEGIVNHTLVPKIALWNTGF
jgi:hypothetical protein